MCCETHADQDKEVVADIDTKLPMDRQDGLHSGGKQISKSNNGRSRVIYIGTTQTGRPHTQKIASRGKSKENGLVGGQDDRTADPVRR
jgi:hypothetical protein